MKTYVKIVVVGEHHFNKIEIEIVMATLESDALNDVDEIVSEFETILDTKADRKVIG